MSQDSWQEIKGKVESLGLKLKLHLDQEKDEADDTAKSGPTKAAIEDLSAKLQDAFSSFGTASKDPAVRSDVKEIGSMLKDAMADTFSNVSSDVSEAFKKNDSSDKTDPPADESPKNESPKNESGDASEPPA